MARWNKRRKIELIETEREIEEKVVKQRLILTRFLKREMLLTAFSILAVTTVIIGGSYAVFTNIQKGARYNVIKTGTLQISYDDTSNGLGNIINLNGAYPESDEEGKKREPYKFKITNTGTINANYKIKILDDTNMIEEDGCQEKLLDKTKIKYSIDGKTPQLLSSIANEYIVVEDSLNAGSSVTYELRMWIDENSGNEVLGRHYHGKIVVEGIQSDRKISAPVMDKNMIQVVYDESSKNWVKADNKNWYNYEEGKWANAVTVSSATRSIYQNATVGSPVLMNDIETMWVWIPRYSYTIGSEDGTNYYGKQGEYLESSPTELLPGEVDIKFISKSEKDKGSAQYKVVDGVSNWRTPDAFTFGDEELSGIWVGKFETSSSNPASYGGGDTTELDAMIKPNVTSWRYIRVSNIAEVGLKISSTGNRYGFANIDSHAMKNTEWASVAYLSQSKYGKLGNRSYSGGNKEVYQSKSNEYLTGCSYGKPGEDVNDGRCHYTYEVSGDGTGSSTTGTIYGIYDMSGGAWEYMMANYAPNGEKYSADSGYTGLLSDGSTFAGKNWLDDKYYNFYTSEDSLTACNGNSCISHGLHELKKWYGAGVEMAKEKGYWSTRGGAHNTDSSIFQYTRENGIARGYISFRLVLIEK